MQHPVLHKSNFIQVTLLPIKQTTVFDYQVRYITNTLKTACGSRHSRCCL